MNTITPVSGTALKGISVNTSWKGFSDLYTFQLTDREREQLGSAGFLSKEQLMDRLKLQWKPMNGLITIHILSGDFAGKPTHKRSRAFVLPGGQEQIFAELANLSDLHGVVSLYQCSLWLAKASDPSELNIDAEVMERIQEILKVASQEAEQRLLEEEQKRIMRNSMYGFGGGK